MSNSFPFDTRISALNSLVISGPATLNAGQTGQYQCLALYADGQQLDVTAGARWSLAGSAPPGTVIAAGHLTAGTGVGSTFLVRAAYQTTSGQRTGEATVTVASGFSVAAMHSTQTLGGTSYRVNLSASASGGSGATTYRWDTNGDGIYGDLTGAAPQWMLTSAGGTYRVGVEKCVCASGAVGGRRLEARRSPGHQPVHTSQKTPARPGGCRPRAKVSALALTSGMQPDD